MKTAESAWAYLPLWNKVISASARLDESRLALSSSRLKQREFRKSTFCLWRPFVWIGHGVSNVTGCIFIGAVWFQLLFWHVIRSLLLIASLSAVLATVLAFVMPSEPDPFGTSSRDVFVSETSDEARLTHGFSDHLENLESPARLAVELFSQTQISEPAKPVFVKAHFRASPSNQND